MANVRCITVTMLVYSPLPFGSICMSCTDTAKEKCISNLKTSESLISSSVFHNQIPCLLFHLQMLLLTINL
jgi:hypothetical protein